jgi:hypothetical protein
MIRTGIVITSVFILFLSIFAFITMPRGKPVVKNYSQKSEELLKIIKDGDIICRLGDRLWSQVFKDISTEDRRFSHLGIIRINDGEASVIHSEGDTGHGRDFVNEAPLDEFIKIARAIGIYRVNDIDGSQISNLAVEYLGIPFDWKFDLNDKSKIYCTELLYIILKRITPEIELNTVYVREIGRDIIPLDAVSKSSHFTEIYYIGIEGNGN